MRWFLVIMLLITPIFANAQDENVLTLSLSDAKEMAVANSPQVALADTGIAKDKVNVDEQNLAQYRSLSPLNMGTAGGTYELALMRSGNLVDAAKTSLRLSELGKEQTIARVEFSVEQAYYSLLSAIAKESHSRAAVSAAESNADAVIKKYDLGVAAEVEKFTAETQVKIAKTQLDIAVRATENACAALANSLSVDLNTKFVLTDSFTPKPLVPVDVNKKVKEALKNRLDLVSAAANIELLEKNLDIFSRFYTPNTFSYKQSAYDLETARQSLESARNSVTLAVRKAYSDMLDAFARTEITQNSIDLLQMSVNIEQSKFDNGLSTSIELIDAQNKLNAEKNNLFDAQLAYHLAKLSFEITCGIGL